jgi:LPS sulfotransferase NodH
MNFPPVTLHEKRLIVLSAARSGSSLFVNYLNSNRQIHCHGELLNSDHGYGSVEGKSKDELCRHVAYFFRPHEELYVGCKFLTHQFDELDITVKDILDLLKYPKVLVLYRRNLLDTYVSLQIAVQTGVWYSSTAVNDVAITLDLEAFREFAYVQRRRWTECLQAIRTLGPHFCLSYEDLVNNPATTMSNAFAFLELESVAVHTDSVKQNPWSLKNKVSNYDWLRLDELAASPLVRLQIPSDESSWQG